MADNLIFLGVKTHSHSIKLKWPVVQWHLSVTVSSVTTKYNPGTVHYLLVINSLEMYCLVLHTYYVCIYYIL